MGKADAGRAAAARPRANIGAKYIASFDGLRAVLSLAVVAGHSGLCPNLTAGSYIAVDVFFVLSGFLITDLLLHEFTAEGRIKRMPFYRRRAARLGPGVAVALALVVLTGCAVARPPGRALTIQVLLQLAMCMNALTYSYHASLAIAAGLFPLWSLCVEEQFYACWPTILPLLARRLSVRIVAMCVGAFCAIGCATLWLETTLERSHSSLNGGSLSYFHTEARIWEPLLGAGAALCLAASPPLWQAVEHRCRYLIAISTAALLGDAALVSFTNGRLAHIDIALPVAAVAATLLVPSLATGEQWAIARILSTRPFRAVGRRSYEIYVLHMPLFMLIAATTHLRARTSYALWMISLAVLTELTYRYLQMPLRRRLRRGAGQRQSDPRAAGISQGARELALQPLPPQP